MLEYQNTKNIVAKGYTLNWSEKVLIGKIKNTVPWRYVVNDLNDKEIIGSFYQKELQKNKKIKKNLGQGK